jgi:hypothetical protein
MVLGTVHSMKTSFSGATSEQTTDPKLPAWPRPPVAQEIASVDISASSQLSALKGRVIEVLIAGEDAVENTVRTPETPRSQPVIILVDRVEDTPMVGVEGRVLLNPRKEYPDLKNAFNEAGVDWRYLGQRIFVSAETLKRGYVSLPAKIVDNRVAKKWIEEFRKVNNTRLKRAGGSDGIFDSLTMPSRIGLGIAAAAAVLHASTRNGVFHRGVNKGDLDTKSEVLKASRNQDSGVEARRSTTPNTLSTSSVRGAAPPLHTTTRSGDSQVLNSPASSVVAQSAQASASYTANEERWRFEDPPERATGGLGMGGITGVIPSPVPLQEKRNHYPIAQVSSSHPSAPAAPIPPKAEQQNASRSTSIHPERQVAPISDSRMPMTSPSPSRNPVQYPVVAPPPVSAPAQSIVVAPSQVQIVANPWPHLSSGSYVYVPQIQVAPAPAVQGYMYPPAYTGPPLNSPPSAPQRRLNIFNIDTW